MDQPKHQFIESEIRDKFSFLQDEFGFTPFKAWQQKDEYYVTAKKGAVEFFVYIQMDDDYPPLISIDHHVEESAIAAKYYLFEMEEDNPVQNIMDYRGYDGIEKFISECAEILKRNAENLRENTVNVKKTAMDLPSSANNSQKTMFEKIVDGIKKYFRQSKLS
ncbi:MAG: hypothetical protein IT270_12880 [Saprospiraceae bacterium]|nr:hypothetical protein [Saprospiraceae bacterium]